MSHPKQPKGLYLLFHTELWERFGFYSLQAIIILFMAKGLHFSDHKAYQLYGTFSSMVYLAPVFGGFLADRVLGYKRSVILGGCLLAIGYFWTSIPHDNFFFWGLGAVIVGNGFFKPNVSSLLGHLYENNDVRREGGFTLFYMGINLGSLFPPLIAGILVKRFGWHSGFLLAAFGMSIGLTIFLIGKTLLGRVGHLPKASPLTQEKIPYSGWPLFLLLGILASIAFFRLLFSFPLETNLFLSGMTLIIITYLVMKMLKEGSQARRKMIACFLLILISVGFWAVYNQTFTSLMLFADRNVDKHFLGMRVNTEFMQFFNPFFIVLLSPFLSKIWVKLEHHKQNPSVPIKFSFGTLLMVLGFFFLSYGTKYHQVEGVVSIWWLIGSYFLQTIGELLLSPIGLSMITTLSPKPLTGMMMGVWFLMVSAAFAIGASLASLAAVPKDAPATESVVIYEHAFTVYGFVALGVAILSFILAPYLKFLIHGTPAPNPIK